jgi:acyl-CoA synthetase (AMP-forming)/AMP-acid ligase II
MSHDNATTMTERDHVLQHFWESANQTIEQYADKEYVVAKNGRLTYREADQHANCIARSLIDTKLSRQTGVGLLLRDPLQIIPAMLGSLKAGHYFIPLDPDYPDNTMHAILESANIKIIISAEEFHSQAARFASQDRMVIQYNEIDLSQKISPIHVEYAAQDPVHLRLNRRAQRGNRRLPLSCKCGFPQKRDQRFHNI